MNNILGIFKIIIIFIPTLEVGECFDIASDSINTVIVTLKRTGQRYRALFQLRGYFEKNLVPAINI